MFWSYWENKKFIKKINNRKWNNRKIAFIAILIATSVSFVLIFTSFFPITSIPTFKLAAAGLPIKLTGYIFGPIIGALTGVISDLLSFAMRPTFFHYWYTIAFAFAGFIPGVIGYFFNRRWLKKLDIEKFFEKKHNNVNFIATICILIVVFVEMFSFIFLQDDDFFQNQKIITNKWVFLVIATFGIVSMTIAILIFRIILKPKTFNSVLAIVAFSALLEAINTPLIALGDFKVYGNDEDFMTILTAHFLFSPTKIWTNLIIILFSYKIVSPLIYNKTKNGWSKEKF